jgi:hypothetical protein
VIDEDVPEQRLPEQLSVEQLEHVTEMVQCAEQVPPPLLLLLLMGNASRISWPGSMFQVSSRPPADDAQLAARISVRIGTNAFCLFMVLLLRSSALKARTMSCPTFDRAFRRRHVPPYPSLFRREAALLVVEVDVSLGQVDVSLGQVDT